MYQWICSPTLWALFLFCWWFPLLWKTLWFDEVQFVYFFFCFPCLIKHCYEHCLRFCCLFFFYKFYGFRSKFKSLVDFEFILVSDVRRRSSLIFLHISVQFSQHYFLNKLSFARHVCLLPLLNINWLQRCGFISGLSILFHLSRCLFLYHAVLITVAP